MSQGGGGIAYFFGYIIGFTVGVVVAVYLWMLLFASWLHYDYVTVSSVFFSLNLVGGLIYAVMGFFMPISPLQKLFVALFWLAFYPFVISTGLGVYEAWSKPEMSSAINVVAAFRAIIGAPLHLLGWLFSHLGDPARHLKDNIEKSPILTNLTTGVITALFARFFLPAKTAPAAAR
jgi:hypothetical protein